MKYIKIILLSLMVMSYVACEKCEDVVLEPCGEEILPNSEHCGWTVATCFAPEGNGDVAVVFNTSYNSQAPKGDDWGTTITVPQVTAVHPANWTANQIGQVYGIAIDEVENIYLASSDIYKETNGFSSLPYPSGNIGRPYSAGQIFKCAPPTWNAVPFVVLPNTATTTMPVTVLNGTGNIAYDKWNKQLFATNLEDGKIYRISTTGGIVETYDPWALDGGTVGIVVQEERVWGVGVNAEGADVKVYFPRVDPSKGERSIYSVTLVNGAFPAFGSEVVEVANVPGKQPIISDIAFSGNGLEMLIAERGHPHESEVNSFSLSTTSFAWNFNKNYQVGGIVSGSIGKNSAGGVDFAYTEKGDDRSAACDEFFWASGNYMDTRNSPLNKVYGLQGISYAGNNPSTFPSPTANQDTDLFIDFDGVGDTDSKRTIGDVEVFDCTKCGDPCSLDDIIK